MKALPYIYRIYLLDGTYRSMPIDIAMSADEVCYKIFEKLRIEGDPSLFALFEFFESQGSLRFPLNPAYPID